MTGRPQIETADTECESYAHDWQMDEPPKKSREKTTQNATIRPDAQICPHNQWNLCVAIPDTHSIHFLQRSPDAMPPMDGGYRWILQNRRMKHFLDHRIDTKAFWHWRGQHSTECYHIYHAPHIICSSVHTNAILY